jgi:hypothetical protein
MILSYDVYHEITTRDSEHKDDALESMSDKIMKLTAEVEKLKMDKASGKYVP